MRPLKPVFFNNVEFRDGEVVKDQSIRNAAWWTYTRFDNNSATTASWL